MSITIYRQRIELLCKLKHLCSSIVLTLMFVVEFILVGRGEGGLYELFSPLSDLYLCCCGGGSPKWTLVTPSSTVVTSFGGSVRTGPGADIDGGGIVGDCGLSSSCSFSCTTERPHGLVAI